MTKPNFKKAAIFTAFFVVWGAVSASAGTLNFDEDLRTYPFLEQGMSELEALQKRRQPKRMSGEQVKERARNLASHLYNLTQAVSPEVTGRFAEGADLREAKKAVFESLIGPRVSEFMEEDGGVNYGDVFKVAKDEAGQRNIMTPDNGPVIVLVSVDLSNAFFYEPTIVDLRTGSIYQAINSGLEGFYGPRIPEEEAQLKGDFSPEEAQLLMKYISQELGRLRREAARQPAVM